jgi:hypothetical protein
MKRLEPTESAQTADFHRAIFEEHIEAAAFLYEQRLLRLGGADRAWTDLADIEMRIELHLDALLVGHDPALAMCAERAIAGEPGELFAALCVFCRRGNAEHTAEVLQALDPAQPARMHAVQHALSQELPNQWIGFVEQAVAQRPDDTAAVLAAVCAYRNLPLGHALVGPLAAAKPPKRLLVDAVGRLRVRESQAALEACLADFDAGLKASALLALCRIGVPGAWRHGLRSALTEAWPRVPVGLAADPSGVRVLVELASTHAADASSLHALALLGDPAALPVLCDALTRPELAEAAAMALHWLTGAQLSDEVFVPDAVDESELIGSELKAWKEQGTVPTRADGRPYGNTVTRLSQDHARWQTWMAENGVSLIPGLRHRLGRLCTPSVLVDALASVQSDVLLRHLSAQELAIRYGCEIPFDVAMPVAHQLRQLQEMGKWAEGQAGRFKPGAWFFAGQAQ